MAIENDKIFDEKKISDIVKEYYQKLQEDRDLVDEIIEEMDLKRPLISPFESEGRSRILGVLLDARQKTTNGLTNIANIAARLQANNHRKEDQQQIEWFEEIGQLAAKQENNVPLLDDVEDLVSNIEEEKENEEEASND